jgi:hypothetical protein
MIHLLLIAGATAIIILCTLLPFLPGRYDAMAVPLATMAQVFGIVALLLVPAGLLWMISEHRSRSARGRYRLAIAALVVASFVWMLVALGAFVESIALGILALALWVYAVSRIVPRLRAMRTGPDPAVTAIPLYMICVPVGVTLIQFALAGPVTESGRSRAIRNSAPLIADIERYRVANGRYPLSLMALSADYLPGVIGVRQYWYEPSGDAFNLFFESFTFRFGTREIVMYNPNDRQAFTSHTMDLLQLTPEQLRVEQTRGHYAVHNAEHPHWKYFWFD